MGPLHAKYVEANTSSPWSSLSLDYGSKLRGPSFAVLVQLFSVWLATLTAVSLGLGSNPEEDMDVCKCIVPSRHGATLNSRRAANLLVRLVEEEERWEARNYLQDVLHQNWGETELNRSVTCMVLKATANDRRNIFLWHDEFRGP
ncbi:uncharacterized protein TNCV_2160291 [Trichonephila clavipes]|nr:uncharacterized protein TNCV_2160291 [Trichonephila clavipes]